MKHPKSSFVTLGLVGALTLTGCLGADEPSASTSDELRVATVPVVPNVTLGDRSLYGTLGARWWQWVFSIPASRTPLIDATGARCAEGQTGAVWFLAGYFTGDPALTSVSRACTIPAGRTLFFPLVNAEFDPWGVEPAPTDDELRTSVRVLVDGTTERYATLDGVAIPRLDRGRGAAGPFTYDIPPAATTCSRSGATPALRPPSGARTRTATGSCSRRSPRAAMCSASAGASPTGARWT